MRRRSLAQLSVVEMRDRGRAARWRRCGSRATARISSTVAGTEPVTPATMTGPCGGERVRRSASARMARLRRAAGDSSLFSSRYAGQNAVTIARKSSVSCQCSENSSGTSAGEPVERHVLGLDHVHQARELGGEVRGLRRRIGARRRGVIAEVRRVAACRGAWSATSAAPAGQHEAALDLADGRRQVERVGAERAGAGEARRAASGLPRPRRSDGSAAAASRARRDAVRKASCRARVARRVGSSSVTSGSSSGSVRGRRPPAGRRSGSRQRRLRGTAAPPGR